VLIFCLYIIGWFPDRFDNHLSSVIHDSSSLIFFTAAAVMVAIISLVLWNRTGWLLKMALGLFVAAWLFGVVSAGFFATFFENNIFWVEVFYMLVFDVFMLSVIYTREIKRAERVTWSLENFERKLSSLIYRPEREEVKNADKS
jgi:Na+/proline symporter